MDGKWEEPEWTDSATENPFLRSHQKPVTARQGMRRPNVGLDSNRLVWARGIIDSGEKGVYLIRPVLTRPRVLPQISFSSSLLPLFSSLSSPLLATSSSDHRSYSPRRHSPSMPAERRQVVSRIISPSNGASVRPSRRRTGALPSAAAAAAAPVDGRGSPSSAEFARGPDDVAAAHHAAGTTTTTTTHSRTHSRTPSHIRNHTSHTSHARNPSSAANGGTGAPTTPTPTPTHRSRPSASLSRASRPQSVYQIVEAYRPLAYSIEKAEQEARAAAAEKRRSLVPSPLRTTTQPTPVADEDDAMEIDEFGQFSPVTATAPSPPFAAPAAAPAAAAPAARFATPAPVAPTEYEDDFAVLRSPARGKQEECISGRGMLKRGYHIILDTALEDSEEARWAAIKRMEAQLRELDKSFTRVAPPASRRRITNLTNQSVTASPSSFSAANRAAWNI